MTAEAGYAGEHGVDAIGLLRKSVVELLSESIYIEIV
jgi:hypothetical protein